MPTPSIRDTLDSRSDLVHWLRCAEGQLRAITGVIEVVLYQPMGGPCGLWVEGDSHDRHNRCDRHREPRRLSDRAGGNGAHGLHRDARPPGGVRHHEIMRLLRRIAKEQGRSVVIVSHDQRIKDIADRVLWLEDGEFKEMVTMATDPVCGMAVEREKAAATLGWAGTTYYFCSKGCRAEFESNQRESIEFNRLACSS